MTKKATLNKGRFLNTITILQSFIYLMKALPLTAFAMISSLLLSAHPGIGLVYDGNRTIYYTDLNHIWKLDTATGFSEIAVSDVHSHELYLDPSGNLYGEHYWYDETQLSFKNYIWKLGSGGNFKKIRNELSGENTDFSFVRDIAGRSYHTERVDEHFTIAIRDSSGLYKILESKFQQPGWKYLTDDGTLYLTDDGSLFALKSNQFVEYPIDLATSRFPFSMLSDQHGLYGIWTDPSRNIYLANYGGRSVLQINKQGKISHVFRSGFLWSPVNGVFDNENQLWLLESSVFGNIRVRRITIEPMGAASPFFLENFLMVILALALIIALFYLFRWRYRKLNL